VSARPSGACPLLTEAGSRPAAAIRSAISGKRGSVTRERRRAAALVGADEHLARERRAFRDRFAPAILGLNAIAGDGHFKSGGFDPRPAVDDVGSTLERPLVCCPSAVKSRCAQERVRHPKQARSAIRSRRADGQRAVAEAVNRWRTQSGHIRNDTRGVSRRISTACNGSICRRKCVASDRACTHVTL
jgi:hypothetical protein